MVTKNNKKTGVVVNGTSYADTITNSGTKVTINAGSGNDTIQNSGAQVSISGGTGDNYIFSSGANVTIVGGKNRDTISLASGSDSVVIQHNQNHGADSIVGFNETSTLKINSQSYTYSSAKNRRNRNVADIIVSAGDYMVSLVGAASLPSIHINDDLILTDETSSPVTVDNSIKTINAAIRTNAIQITGNKLANTIIGGKDANTISGGAGNDSLIGGKSYDYILGDAGNDSLYGEAGNDYLDGGAGNDRIFGYSGNDTLYGGAGNDIFIYKPGDGTDTIYDYQSGDMLTILKVNGKEGGTYNAATFADDTLTLSIKGGGKVVFASVSEGTKININDTTHTISNGTLK